MIDLLKIAAAALTLMGGMNAMAQAPTTALAEDTTTPDSATPAMWRITDADSEFILLGTFHFLPPELNWRTDAIEGAIAAADVIYFELEADAPDFQSKAISAMMLNGLYPPGEHISDTLTPDEIYKLREITNSLGLLFSGIDAMRPWRAALSLEIQYVLSQGLQPGAGVEHILLSEARTLGKELRFFETVEQQFSMFSNLSPETERAYLLFTLNHWPKYKQSLWTLYDAWKTGDTSAIDQLMNEDDSVQTPEFFQTVIIDRNEAWAEEIANAMNEGAGNALIAVGVGHLVGDEYSVPALLKAKGFKVSRYGLDEIIQTDIPAGEPANDNAAVEDDIGVLLEAINENRP
ncbi:MAG: TraB/GumN family protein [Alphaproteobacteria bacterium]|nr:TraB/GumN family protein [Alphaproteobacteria bacterium]